MKKEKKIFITLSSIDYKKLKSMAKKEKISIEEFVSYLVYGAIYKDKKPNKETLKAMEDAEKGIGLTYCKDINEMWKLLGLEK